MPRLIYRYDIYGVSECFIIDQKTVVSEHDEAVVGGALVGGSRRQGSLDQRTI